MGRRIACAAFCAAILPAVAAAQLGSFGENKIQYRGFDWHVLRGEHVDLYYYPDEEELGRVALAYAEESYGVLQQRFTHHPSRRVPLIIYASHTDFEQTNVLPFVPPEGLLGVTEFLKQRVALPFNGSYTDFRHTIRHELVHVFQLSVTNQVLQRYPRQKHVSFPLWWSEGLAEFWSAGEDSRYRMILRDMTISGHLPTLEDLTEATGTAVYPLGATIHRFLAEAYGEWRIVAMYDELWKYLTFEEAVRAVYGRSLHHLSDEWQFWMRQHYYPAVATAEPLALRSELLARMAVKPVAYVPAGTSDTGATVLFFSPSNGYTDIYARPLSRGGSHVLIKGERSDQFESFHFFESRLDVSPAGVVAFSSKYLDRDALFLWDIPARRVVGRYQFPELISILSPAWAPDGRSVVFSGLALSGYSDLYRLWLADARLERLTSDRYQDIDPTFSPDGRSIVFCSDRTAFGPQGARNLFTLDLATGVIDYLTYGDWHDDQPRWSPATGRIYFSSDRDGLVQLYSIDSTGTGRRETNTLNGAFDPEWVEQRHEIVFGGFADLSFNIYAAAPVPDSVTAPIALAPDRGPASWTWTELENPQYARADASPYGQKFTLDFAAGDASVVAGLGSAQGAVFLLSDMLGDHQLYFTLSSFQGAGLGNILDNVNGSVLYLNQAHHVNWGVGAFRTRGLFYEDDLSSVYQETTGGVLVQIRYPLSRFRRIELQHSVEYSDRFDIAGTYADLNALTDLHRVAWLASNYLSYVKDNTIWLSTGPIDGERFNVTGGLVNDVSHGRFDSWLVASDWRHYFRTSLRGAIALRAMGYYAGGERPRPVNIGGSWAVRGYPIYGYIAGARAWLVNTEWRFPIVEFLSFGFPFGTARFPGVQGALFADAGRAWSAGSAARGTIGASGLSLRMPVGQPLVLRLDLGYRYHWGTLAGYALPVESKGTRFVDFFFGFNY